MGNVNPFRPFAFADALTSGLVGHELTAALQERFADITRADVFLGCRTAASIWAAELIEAKAERDVALAERDTLRLDLDLAQTELEHLRAQVRRMWDTGSWLRPAPVLEAAA